MNWTKSKSTIVTVFCAKLTHFIRYFFLMRIAGDLAILVEMNMSRNVSIYKDFVD